MLHGRRCLPKGSSLLPISNYSVSSVQYLKQNFDYLKKRLDRYKSKSLTTVAFITDIHLGAGASVRFNPFSNKSKTSSFHRSWSNRNNGNWVNRLDRACVVLRKLSEVCKIDALILGGDYLGNDVNTTKAGALGHNDILVAETYTAGRDYSSLRGINTTVMSLRNHLPIFICRGNHDANSMNSYNNTINFNEFTEASYGKLDTSVPEHSLPEGMVEIKPSCKVVYGDDNHSYGYLDDEKNKIRLLFLNSADIDLSKTNIYTSNPDTKLANLTHNYNLQYNWFLGQTQLNWLVNVALNFPVNKTGWGVIVFSHHQFLKDAGKISDDCLHFMNRLFIRFRRQEVFNETCTFSSDSQFSQFNLSLNVNFGEINAGAANVYCFIHGHYHTTKTDMRYYKVDGNGDIQFSSSSGWSGYLATLSISSFGSTGGDTWDGRRYEHTVGTGAAGVKETEFPIFQFERSGSYLYIYENRYGNGLSSTYRITMSTGQITIMKKDFHIYLKDNNGDPVGGIGDKISLEFNGAKLIFQVVSTLPTAGSSYTGKDYLQISGDNYIFTRCIKYTESNKTKYGWYGKTLNSAKVTWSKGHFYFYDLPINEPFTLKILNTNYQDVVIDLEKVDNLSDPYEITLT